MSDEVSETGVASGAAGVDWGDLLQRLSAAAKNLVNLQIVTVVGTAQLSGEVESPQVAFPDQGATEGNVFVTNINLVDSDITNVIPPKYADDGGRALEFHEEQVRQAIESMERKLALLRSMGEELMGGLGGEANQPAEDEG